MTHFENHLYNYTSKIESIDLGELTPGEPVLKIKKINPIMDVEKSTTNVSQTCRKELNCKFKELQLLLSARLRLFGRRSPPLRDTTPKKGTEATERRTYIPSLEEGYLRQERMWFIQDLCKILAVDEKKVNKDFFDRPFLYPYEIQTSQDRNSKVKNFAFPSLNSKFPEYDQDMFYRYSQRVIDNTRGVAFSIFDSAYAIYGDCLDLSYFNRFILTWILIFMQGRFSKIYKLQTTLLFCKATNQKELPEYTEMDIYPLTKPGFLAGGKLFRYFRNKMSPADNRAVPFFYSLMQGKRCTQSLSWKDELASLIKHKKNMQGAAFKGKEKCVREKIVPLNIPYQPFEVVLQPEDSIYSLCSNELSQTFFKKYEKVPTYMGTSGEVTDAACAKVDWIVKNKIHYRPLKWRAPSINSTFTHSRADCGAQGWFADYLKTKLVFVGFVEEGWKPVPVYGSQAFVDGIDEWYDYLKVSYCHSSYLEPTNAQIHTVLEPLKARIITSGDAPLYHFARMIQKIVHGQLRHDKYMALMGRRHEAQYFSEEFSGNTLPKDWFFVAGDYDAATDGMNPRMSLQFADSVSDALRLTDEERRWYKSTMCGHIINYPNWAKEAATEQGENLDEVIQVWGQLMGSPSSFPALCTINIAGFWVAAETYEGKSLKYSELEKYCVKVNGDDIVFISDDRLYQIWKDTMTELGLTPSIGKNFQADNWMMINSTCYWIDFEERKENGDRVISGIRDMDHIDPGLVAGRSKVQGDTRHEELKGLAADANLFATAAKLRQAVSCRSAEVTERMTESFLYHNGKALKSTTRSWTLPDVFGGLGLPGDCNNSTRMQKLVALKLLGENSITMETGKDEAEINKIFSKITLGKPDVVRGNAVPAYQLPSKLRNDYSSGKTGYKIPDFSHLEISNAREVSEGTIFERTLRKTEKSVRGIDLSFLDYLDFNSLKEFKFEGEESLKLIRPSFPVHLKFGRRKGESGTLQVSGVSEE
jgi:hypothetical protein